jgi:hypothetical protein
MFFSPALVASFLAVAALAGPLYSRDDHDNEGGLKRICPHLATQDQGCIRCQ